MVIVVVAFVTFMDYFIYGLVIPLTPFSPAGVKSEEASTLSTEPSSRTTPSV